MRPVRRAQLRDTLVWLAFAALGAAAIWLGLALNDLLYTPE